MSVKWFTMTMRPTVEFASEVVARAGGRGTGEEIKEFQDSAEFRQRVRGNAVRLYISSMMESGYVVVDVALSVPPNADGAASTVQQ